MCNEDGLEAAVQQEKQKYLDEYGINLEYYPVHYGLIKERIRAELSETGRDPG